MKRHQPIFAGALALLFCAFAPRAGAQSVSQSIFLGPGWNAVYVEVSPEETADEVFSAWPVDSVGIYDPASFLSTRQFTADSDTQGLSLRPISMWRRGVPDASPVERIPAGVVCMAFNTGFVFRTTISGVPAAPRTTWHVTDGETVFNLFGFSVQDREIVTPDAYLDGFGGIEGKGRKCWMIGGFSRDDTYELILGNTSSPVENGEVLLLPSSEVSDWSGALFVSPMLGLDFGTNATVRTLEVRNDGAAARTVALRLDRSLAELDSRVVFSPSFLRWRDADVARTNAAWNALRAGAFGEIARSATPRGSRSGASSSASTTTSAATRPGAPPWRSAGWTTCGRCPNSGAGASRSPAPKRKPSRGSSSRSRRSSPSARTSSAKTSPAATARSTRRGSPRASPARASTSRATTKP